MKNKITQFCNALEKLDPEKSDGIIAEVYDLVDLLEGVSEISIIYDPVFRFLEKYPSADIGNPGPLVHLLESHYANYVPTLIAAIEQKATYNFVVMLYRIMNSEFLKEDQSKYLSLLKAAADSNTTDKMTKENAQEFYDLHIEKIKAI